MEKNTTIRIPKGTKYLNDVLSELPVNSLFDKGRVGCGGTTIALKSSENYVIAVPFVSLIENKVAQYKGSILGVTGDTTEIRIKDYIDERHYNNEPKKIMVTYDSLHKLINYINPQEYSLLIDEYHLLFTQYSFRRKAIQSLLGEYNKYLKFCFMTATVLEDEFILEELKHLPIVKAEWEEINEVVVVATKCVTHVSHTVTAVIQAYLSGKYAGNAYFYVNSVEFIEKMVKQCGLNDENTRAIWSNNNTAEVGLIRGSSTDLPKKINFITSTCFEGADFYDEEGKTYIVSDGTKQQTLVNISTSFQQIAGRIRNTKYWNKIYHVYSNTRYDVNITYEEYKRYTEEFIEESKDIQHQFNQLNFEARKHLPDSFNELYMIKGEDGLYIFDPNRVKIDLYNFKITKCLYKLRINVVEELQQNGFKVVDSVSDIRSEVVNMDSVQGNFKEVVQHLQAVENAPSDYGFDIIIAGMRNTPLHHAAFLKYRFLEEAIYKIGFKEIEKLKYNQTNIKRKLINLLPSSDTNKIYQHISLNKEVATGAFIPAVRAKEIIRNAYISMGLQKQAKGTDLSIYYDVKSVKKKIKGESIRGFIIMRPKYEFAE